VSGATASDANAVFQGDAFQFKDGVSGKTNLRYLTFIGHRQSANPVHLWQLRMAAADGSGNVIISINNPLNWAGGANQNLNTPICCWYAALTFPSHRAGGIVGGDAFYIAMPQLPEQSPFDTANEADPETGV